MESTANMKEGDDVFVISDDSDNEEKEPRGGKRTSQRRKKPRFETPAEASGSTSKPVPEIKEEIPSTSKQPEKVEEPANESEKYDILTTLEGAAFQSRLVSNLNSP